MLKEKGIGRGGVGEEVAARAAVAAGTGEEHGRAAPQLMDPKIGRGDYLLVMDGVS